MLTCTQTDNSLIQLATATVQMHAMKHSSVAVILRTLLQAT